MRAWLKTNKALTSKEIKEGSCPDGIPEDHWAAFLEEELQLQAYFERQGYIGLTTRIASGSWPNIIDPVDLQLTRERWIAELVEMGDPPKSLIDARERVKSRKEATHRMGQGGVHRLSVEFVSSSSSFLANRLLSLGMPRSFRRQ